MPACLAALWLAAAGSMAQSVPYRILESTGACGGLPYPTLADSPVRGFTAGDKLLFVGIDPANGQDLWAADGSPGGFGLLKNIVATSSLGKAHPDWGVDALKVTHTVERGPVAYFRRQIDPHCGTWYRTDGTLEGTILVDDLKLSLDVNAMDGEYPVKDTGSFLYFFYLDDADKPQVWKTDFTETGSCKITDTLSLGTIDPMFGLHEAGAWVLFAAKDASGSHWICRTNGTAAGTARVARIATPIPDSDGFGDKQVVGDRLYFPCRDSAHGVELWKTDGTAAGTGLVKDILPGGANGLVRMVNGTGMDGAPRLFFEANDGAQGRRLWQSDGTDAGTRTVAGLPALSGIDFVCLAGRLGSTCYFHLSAQQIAADSGIWRTDGVASQKVHASEALPAYCTVAGQRLLLADQLGNLSAIGNGDAHPELLVPREEPWTQTMLRTAGARAFFWSNANLYASDGTVQGTVQVASSARPSNWSHVSNGLLYFWSNQKLWRSDGTVQGTYPIEYGCSQAGGVVAPNARILGTLGSTVLLAATAATGHQTRLWKTDGTRAGTAQVSDLELVYRSTPERNGKNAAVMGASLYFAARDYSTGLVGLWKTDGSGPGTVKVIDVSHYGISEMTVMGTRLFLAVNDEQTAWPTLWKSDGTADGTVKVSDATCSELTPAGSTLYFVNGTNLWKSNGTAVGTTLHARYDNLGLRWPSLQFLTGFGPRLFYELSYHSGAFHTSLYDFRPYVCNSPTSTPIRPKDTFSTGWFNPTRAPVLNGGLYLALWDASNGSELWKSDGTATGTTLVKNISPGPAPSLTAGLAWGLLDKDLYFSAADGEHGVELWKTNGTADGTVLVKDIHRGTIKARGKRCADAAGSIPHDMYTGDDAVYFAAADDLTGTELWMTRGTEESTVRLSDLNAGPGSSNPSQFTLAGDRLVFTATDGTDRGTELWAIALPTKRPANPGAVVLGPNAIVWTWEDMSTGEAGFRVWSNAGTATPTTLRATLPANATSWRQNGFTANMQYSFRVASTGEFGDSQSTETFTAWTLAVDPAGLQFLQVGKDGMTVTVSPAPPNLTQGESGLLVENQTRGTNSGWMQSASGWTSGGLSPNRAYTFIGRVRNGAGVETLPVAETRHTLAATPHAPTVENPGVHALELSRIGGTGNPSYTLYAVQVSPPVGGKAWVQADGSLDDEACFQTAGAWTPILVTGLAENTTYAFSTIARNGDGVDTVPGPAGTGTTLDVTPPTAVITLLDPNPLNAPAVRFGVTFNEPVAPTFVPDVITPAGTLAGTAAVTGRDPAYIVTIALANPAQDGTVGIAVGPGVTDRSGNACAGGASGLYTLTHWAGFTQQPQGARLYMGQSHVLQVGVNTGGLPTSYQWKHMTADGTVSDGPTTPQWPLPQLGAGNAGDYWCEVTNGGVPHPSLKVTVSVASHLRITRQPAGGDACYGDTWAFSVEADGGYPPLHYQWRREQQQDCPDGTEAVYVIGPLEPGDAGLYNVEIHDSHTDMLESYPVRLTLTERVPAADGAALAVMAGLLALATAGTMMSRKKRGKLP